MKRAQTAGLSDRSVFYRYRLFKKITKTCRICLLTSVMMPFATLVFLSFFSRFTFFSLFPFTYIDIIFILLIFSRDGIKRIYRHGILYRIYGGCSDISAASAQYESRRDKSERYRRKSSSSESFFRAQFLHDKTTSGRDICQKG